MARTALPSLAAWADINMPLMRNQKASVQGSATIYKSISSFSLFQAIVQSQALFAAFPL
jgi:hypothetical protein